MSAIDLVAFSWGRLRPRGGDLRRGMAQLLRAVEMRLKTLGSDAGPPACGGGGWVGEPRGARGAPVGSIETSALAGAGQELSSVAGGGENGSASPPPGCVGLSLTAPPPPPGQPGGQAFRGLESSGPRAKGRRAPSVRGGGGGRAPAGRRGARGWEGLGGLAGPAKPEGQRRRSCTPVLGNEHLAAPGDPRTTRARREVRMPLVSYTAAAADAPAQASAPGARWCPMLQAERALGATARTQRAAALWSRERDTLGRRPRGPPSIRQEGRPSLERAGVSSP